MATVRFGGGVAEIRASVAGTTYSRNRGGAYQRNRVKPLNPRTSFQTQQRDRLTDLSTNWGGLLTQAQRDQWTAFAALYPRTNVFGASVILTGQQFYVAVNTELLSASLPVLTVPGANMDVTQLLTLSATFALAGPTATVVFTPTPTGANHYLQVFATPGVPPGRKYVKNALRLIFTSAVNAASPQSYYTAWSARFGADPVAGQRIGIEARLINSTNGAVGQRLRADAIVV